MATARFRRHCTVDDESWRDTVVVPENLWAVSAARSRCCRPIRVVEAAVVRSDWRELPRQAIDGVTVCMQQRIKVDLPRKNNSGMHAAQEQGRRFAAYSLSRAVVRCQPTAGCASADANHVSTSICADLRLARQHEKSIRPS